MAKKKSKKTGAADFKKVKLKVGRTLKKPTVTDTKFSATKITLLGQLTETKNENEDNSTGQGQGQNLHVLCGQLSHHNVNVRKNTIVSLKQQLQQDFALITHNRALLLRTLGKAIQDSNLVIVPPMENVLLGLCEQLMSEMDSGSMAPHFALLLAHISCAMSSNSTRVQMLALRVLDSVLTHYGSLCRCSVPLVDLVCGSMSSALQPGNTKSVWLRNSSLSVPVLSRFVQVMLPSATSVNQSVTSAPCSSLHLDTQQALQQVCAPVPQTHTLAWHHTETGPFDCAVLSAHAMHSTGDHAQSTVLTQCTLLHTFLQVAAPFLRHVWLAVNNSEDSTSLSADQTAVLCRVMQTMTHLVQQCIQCVHTAQGGLASAHTLSLAMHQLLNKQFTRPLLLPPPNASRTLCTAIKHLASHIQLLQSMHK